MYDCDCIHVHVIEFHPWLHVYCLFNAVPGVGFISLKCFVPVYTTSKASAHDQHKDPNHMYTYMISTPER